MPINRERICENCKMFCVMNPKTQAVDVMTGESIPAGRRDCSVKNIAWGDSPCTTGEFEAKSETLAENA